MIESEVNMDEIADYKTTATPKATTNDGIPVFCSHDDIIPTAKLKENPLNPNFHPKEQITLLADIIERTGWRQPITISNQSGCIVKGHGRLAAAKLKGWCNVPVDYQDYSNKDEEYADLIADNRLAELSEIQEDVMAELIQSFDDSEMLNLTGYSEEEIDDILNDLKEEEDAEVVEDDYEPELPAEPKAKHGDIYQLGNHRLMCGDSTSVTDIEKLLNGSKIDLCLTDPPYGISVVGDNGKVGSDNLAKNGVYMPVKGDETTETAKKNYGMVKKISENQIIFGGNYFTDFLEPKSCWLVWDKENTGNFADVELAWTSFEKGAKLYKWLWNGLCRKGERSIEGKTRVHPTQKPVGLVGEILKDFSKERDIILDCFGGSGTTLIACEQLNRSCYMIEYEPHYIDVIIDRWEQFTGEKAVLIEEK